MPRFVLYSHDGYGLGHVRRNVLIARALLADDAHAEITIVTGVARRPAWLDDPRFNVVAVPSLVKSASGVYRNDAFGFHDALERRSTIFSQLVDRVRPHVIVVDRHPLGTGGELTDGLERARATGSSLVLGLRDVLDEPAAVAREIASAPWRRVPELYDAVLVYGERWLCDQVSEYGLPVEPYYCGWVTEMASCGPYDPRLVVLAAGGGADGQRVLALGATLLASRPYLHAVAVAGPYAGDDRNQLPDSVTVVRSPNGCMELYRRAGAVVQMGGYNSTFEALAAGIRPIIVPRRSPRREQAIRASRLAAVGLADVVDDDAEGAEVAWLLDRPRRFAPDVLSAVDLCLDGATRSARLVGSFVRAGVQ